MSVVKKFKVTSRFAELAFAKGGLGAGELLARADVAMQAERGDCLAELDAALAEVRRVVEARRLDALTDDGFYARCSILIDFAWCMTGEGFGQAAYSLCEMVDRGAAVGDWDWPGLAVHVDSLRLLRESSDALSAESQAEIVDGLIKVSQRNDRKAV